MSSFKLTYALLLLFGVFISSVSQVLLKKAAMEEHGSFIREYLNPKVVLAYSIFAISTILSILSYRGIPLSMGPLLEATSYIYVTLFGVKVFGETINTKKLYGLLLIITGILI